MCGVNSFHTIHLLLVTVVSEDRVHYLGPARDLSVLALFSFIFQHHPSFRQVFHYGFYIFNPCHLDFIMFSFSSTQNVKTFKLPHNLLLRTFGSSFAYKRMLTHSCVPYSVRSLVRSFIHLKVGWLLILFWTEFVFWQILWIYYLCRHRYNTAPPSWKNKAGYTATPVACGWAGAVFEVRGAFGQEQ